MRYVLASLLALSLTGIATFAKAQDDNYLRILNSLQQVRTMMYLMAKRDKSMMAGVRNIDRTIAMVRKKMQAAKRAR